MSNLISRQQAIEALKICDNNEDGINCYKCPLRDARWDGAWQDDETSCYRKLMRDSAELLSAQPNLQPTCNQLATDAISRQAVLDMLNVSAELLRRALELTDVVGDGRVKYEMELELIEAYISDVKELPSVQPEYKKGRWILDDKPNGGFWVCSECKFPSEAFAANMLYKFCPNCGRLMVNIYNNL